MRSDWEPSGPSHGRDRDGEDVLEAGDELSFRPSSAAIVLVLLLVGAVVGVPRLLEWRADRRERAAVVAAEKERQRLERERVEAEQAAEADRVSLDVVRLQPVVRPAPAAGQPDDALDAEIELTFTVRNRAGAVKVHEVTFTPIGLPGVPVSHPDSIPTRATVDLVARVRVPCDLVLDLNDDGAAGLALSATPVSGRRQTIDSLLRNHPLPLTSDLRNSCGLQSPWEAADVEVEFVPSLRDRLAYLVVVQNISRRPLVVDQISTPGMSVSSTVQLPLELAPSESALIPLDLRIVRCDALGIPVSGLTDDYEPLLRLAVVGVNSEPAQLVVNVSNRSRRYLTAKHRLLAKQCPLQVKGA